MLPPTLKWEGDALRLLDQRALPLETKYRICRDYEEVAAAIEDMTVRGAPAIGVAAAYGLALAEREGEFAQAAKRLAATRPTAVNLFWAIKRMEETRAAHCPTNARLLRTATPARWRPRGTARRSEFSAPPLRPARSSKYTPTRRGRAFRARR